MSYKSELEIIYDAQSFPIAGMCKLCGAYMRTKDGLLDAADAVMWYSGQFSIHRQEKHLAEIPSGSE